MIMDCEKYVGKCECGREHELETKKVVVEYGATANFEQYMADVGLAGKKRTVIYDSVIYKLTEGKHVAADQEIILEANGLRLKLRLLDFFGREAEEETVTLREIEILEVGTQEEQMYAVLEELERERMTLLPPQDGDSGE